MTAVDSARVDRVLAATRLCAAELPLPGFWITPASAIASGHFSTWFTAGYCSYALVFPFPADGWYLARAPRAPEGPTLRVFALDNDGRPIRARPLAAPKRFFADQPFENVLAVTLPFRTDGGDRLMVFDSALGQRALSFLQRLVREFGPAVYGVFLLGRLRARVGAAERERVARDLHDSAIDAILSIDSGPGRGATLEIRIPRTAHD